MLWENIKLLDEIAELIKNRAPIPQKCNDHTVYPLLENYDFPSYIITDEIIGNNLTEKNIEKIKNAIISADSDDPKSIIRYFAPWETLSIHIDQCDYIVSSAVLEHIDAIDNAYRVMSDFTKPGGCMSHLIDFRCHGASSEYNGQYKFSKQMWKMIKGKREWYINRFPLSVHIEKIKSNGFSVPECVRYAVDDDRTSVKRKQLASEFKNISDEDLKTARAYIFAQKNDE